MKKRTMTDRSLIKMKCTGCGRHEKLVNKDVVAYFCNHCFLQNGNYNRHKGGYSTFKPLEGIRVKDRLVGADGNIYIVQGKHTTYGEDKVYPVKKDGSKELVFLGDWFFVSKDEVANI